MCAPCSSGAGLSCPHPDPVPCMVLALSPRAIHRCVNRALGQNPVSTARQPPEEGVAVGTGHRVESAAPTPRAAQPRPRNQDEVRARRGPRWTQVPPAPAEAWPEPSCPGRGAHFRVPGARGPRLRGRRAPSNKRTAPGPEDQGAHTPRVFASRVASWGPGRGIARVWRVVRSQNLRGTLVPPAPWYPVASTSKRVGASTALRRPRVPPRENDPHSRPSPNPGLSQPVRTVWRPYPSPRSFPTLHSQGPLWGRETWDGARTAHRSPSMGPRPSHPPDPETSPSRRPTRSRPAGDPAGLG